MRTVRYAAIASDPDAALWKILSNYHLIGRANMLEGASKPAMGLPDRGKQARGSTHHRPDQGTDHSVIGE